MDGHFVKFGFSFSIAADIKICLTNLPHIRSLISPELRFPLQEYVFCETEGVESIFLFCQRKRFGRDRNC